jgi:hypothetical protein
MAAAEGYSQTNTLLVVVAVAAVAYVLYQRRQPPVAAPRMGAAPGAGAGGLTPGEVSGYAKAGADVARGIADLIGAFKGADEPADTGVSYLLTASPDAIRFCIDSGYVDAEGNPTRQCVETYG